MAEPTPLDWLVRMKAELDARQVGMRQMDAYYKGEHPLPFGYLQSKWRI